MRILFVDDEPKILQALHRALRSFRNEWEMVFAEGGAAALEQCATSPFDVVISDARMPGMEGPQLLSEVTRLYPDTVRMILSGQCSRYSVLKCVAVAHQFLNKPCEPGTLKSAVQRVCKMRESFHDCTTRKAISRVQRLPSQAGAYRELADAIESPNTTTEILAGIIARDVGMTAKVVQLVSSGFFGSPQCVKSAEQAVSLIGLERIRALFTSSGAFQSGFDDDRDEDLQQLTDHSIAVAAAASKIAKTLSDNPALVGEAYLAGILHEVGTLALVECDQRHPPDRESTAGHQGAAAWRSADSHPDRACPDPGGYLAALWGVPDPIVQAIAYHRVPGCCPEETPGPLVAVHVANAFLSQSQAQPNGETGALDTDYLREVGCAERLETWRDICAGCRTEGVLQ